MATPKQQKLIKLLVENYGSVNNTRSLGSLMLEAGYSENSSTNPYMIIQGEGIQDGIEDFVKMLDDKRRMALTKITEAKLEGSSSRDLAYVSDILTKNHQLLSGGETESIKVHGVEISVRK